MKTKNWSLLTALTASLLIFSACEKSESETQPNTQTDTSLSTDNQQQSTNLVYNGDFEEGLVVPNGWFTKNQFLTDSTGWVTDEAHSGKHSLKIENIGGTDAYWQGQAIVFDKPANSFDASIWILTKDIKETKGTLALAFDVYIKDADNKEVKKRVAIDLSQTAQDWNQTKGKALFAENIIKIIPYVYFFGNVGTIYADNLHLSAKNIDFSNGNVLFDSNMTGTFTDNAILISDNDAEKIYEVNGEKTIFSSDFIPVDSGKVYKLSGDFKPADTNPTRVLFGYAPYTAIKEFITKQSVNYIEGTNTQLTKECNTEDKIIYVKNAVSWIPSELAVIAFNTDDSGNYSDLPNFNLSTHGINSVTKHSDYYEIVLNKPCGVKYPAGTKVRLHKLGSTYIYSIDSKNITLNSWESLSNLITANESYLNVDKFHPGTKFVKILLLPNFNYPTASIAIKNVKLIESNN